MLIQNISSAASTPGFTSDSGSVPVAAPVPVTQAAPVELPQASVKHVAEQQTAQPTPAQLKTAVDNINSAVQKSNPEVEFSIDQSTKETVIKVIDSQTGKLITQFPSKTALAVSQMIGESQSGALVKQQA
jgi:flagellar protein FlaG